MFLDLTVVYFAFGAPLGVYEIARNKRSPRAAALAAVHFVLWPLFAAGSLRRSFTVERPEPSSEQQIEDLRTEFETALDRQHADDILQFRDIFARYTGLAVAAANVNNTDGPPELSRAAKPPTALAASASLARRSRRRLEFHLL